MNEGQEAFRRFARQIRVPGGGINGRFSGGPGGGLFAGSGLLIALVAGGFALNSALFNGKSSLASDLMKHSSYSVDGGHRAIKYSRYIVFAEQEPSTDRTFKTAWYKTRCLSRRNSLSG